jgi:FkbM family methyltransferase
MKSLRKKISRIYSNLRGYQPVTICGQPFKVDIHHSKFWRGLESSKWEPETFDILKRYIKPDYSYCDIGAWIGPTVLYAAHRCKELICFEPDPVAYRYLCENISLNNLKNVTSFSLALSDSTGIRSMASFGGDAGDSMTSLLDGGKDSTVIHALTMNWIEFIKLYQNKRFDFIKIDIEGGEFALLPAMKEYLLEHRPTVYLATHAPFLARSERYERMRAIADVMSIYDTCLDHRMRQVEIADLTNEKTLNHFHSYVFLDRASEPIADIT